VRISQADHPAKVRFPSVLGRDGENAEVACSTMAQGMSFLLDQKSRGSQLVFHLSEDDFVTQGEPGVGFLGCGNGQELLSGDELGSTMEKQPWRMPLHPGLGVFDDIHWNGFL